MNTLLWKENISSREIVQNWIFANLHLNLQNSFWYLKRGPWFLQLDYILFQMNENPRNYFHSRLPWCRWRPSCHLWFYQEFGKYCLLERPPNKIVFYCAMFDRFIKSIKYRKGSFIQRWDFQILNPSKTWSLRLLRPK